MTVWDITLSNRTGSKVDVMVFQTVPDSFIYGSYFAAWKVENTPDPGNIRLELPETFEFYVIDYLGEDERQTGPFQVKYGDEVKVSQPTAANSPTVTINFDENIPKDRIKVINLNGNAQPLEMALFKKDRKLVFYKNIEPNAFVFLAIKSSVYMAAVGGVKPGQEFRKDSFLGLEIQSSSFPVHKIVHSDEIVGYSVPAEFKLLEEKPVMKIQITKKSTGEYVLSESNN
jgi:hypothetical protein